MIYGNKIRPGAYISFESNVKEGFQIQERGIVTMPLNVEWGEDDKLTTVTIEDILTGKFKNQFGDTDVLLLELALYGCKEVLLYSINKGNKATATIGDNLTVTAKYGGEYGNNIKIGIQNSKVITEVDGEILDEQSVTDLNELIDNDWVSFEGDGDTSDVAFTMLSGGTNGNGSNNYENYFKLLKTKKWNVLAGTDKSMNEKIKILINNLRENEGVKVQAVLFDDSADYEGIIKLKNQSLKLENKIIKPEELTAYVSGITAGATATESNTNKVTPFTSIVDEYTNEEIEEALTSGFFVFSYRTNGKVRCEKDINSFTSFSKKKGRDFRKNKIIRINDDIYISIKTAFEDYYQGITPNNEMGRDTLKGEIIGILDNLQRLNVIEDFKTSDLQITKGDNNESIKAELNYKPVDSMEYLYMLIKLT